MSSKEDFLYVKAFIYVFSLSVCSIFHLFNLFFYFALFLLGIPLPGDRWRSAD